MSILAVIFGILSGCFLAVLVGIIGSSRRIGFGLAFLVSLIFTPLVGLIVALLTDPLPGGGQRWGCVGTVVAILGLLFFAAFLLLALTGGAMLLALGKPERRWPYPFIRPPGASIPGYSSKKVLPPKWKNRSGMPTGTTTAIEHSSSA